MRYDPGLVLILTGIIHNLSAFVFPNIRQGLQDLSSNGVLGAGLATPSSALAMWYLCGGFFMMFAGRLLQLYLRDVPRAGGRLPREVGVSLFLIGLFGTMLAPKGGFWLALLQGAYIAAGGTSADKRSQ